MSKKDLLNELKSLLGILSTEGINARKIAKEKIQDLINKIKKKGIY